MWVSESELARLIGEEQAYKFMFHFGSRRIYIPQTAQSDGIIVQRMGLEVAEKLSRGYPRLTIEIPSVIRRKTAKQEVMELLSAGAHDLTKIAVIVGVSRRYVEITQKEWRDSHQYL